MAWNSVCRTSWPPACSHNLCLCHSRAGNAGVCHHTRFISVDSIWTGKGWNRAQCSHSVCLACRQPWVWSTAPHMLGMLVYIYNCRPGKMDEFKVLISNRASSIPAWVTWNTASTKQTNQKKAGLERWPSDYTCNHEDQSSNPSSGITSYISLACSLNSSRDGERREILEFLTYSLAEKNLRSRFRRRRNG